MRNLHPLFDRFHFSPLTPHQFLPEVKNDASFSTSTKNDHIATTNDRKICAFFVQVLKKHYIYEIG